MHVNERMTVVQKCTGCNQQTTHTVVCESIDNGMEQRLYVCDNCQNEEQNQVEHRETLHDKLRTNRNARNIN